jgi:hypothetical protein
MNNTLALTPALSPRRGGAKNAHCYTTSLAALVVGSNAVNRLNLKMAPVALPLLGERAGVRADIPSSQVLGLGPWSLDISPTC